MLPAQQLYTPSLTPHIAPSLSLLPPLSSPLSLSLAALLSPFLCGLLWFACAFNVIASSIDREIPFVMASAWHSLRRSLLPLSPPLFSLGCWVHKSLIIFNRPLKPNLEKRLYKVVTHWKWPYNVAARLSVAPKQLMGGGGIYDIQSSSAYCRAYCLSL